jgi:hypothetical protein
VSGFDRFVATVLTLGGVAQAVFGVITLGGDRPADALVYFLLATVYGAAAVALYRTRSPR